MDEGDITLRLPRGHIGAFGGCVFYGDNDPTGNNHRDVFYYSIEAVHDVTRRLYAGARVSQISARLAPRHGFTRTWTKATSLYDCLAGTLARSAAASSTATMIRPAIIIVTFFITQSKQCMM